MPGAILIAVLGWHAVALTPGAEPAQDAVLSTQLLAPHLKCTLLCHAVDGPARAFHVHHAYAKRAKHGRPVSLSGIRVIPILSSVTAQMLL